MSESRYKTITLYFDISNEENMSLYETISDKAQKNKKSSFVISILQGALRNSPTAMFSDQMCKDIADRIADNLKMQLAYVSVPTENSDLKDLIADMDSDLPGCEF